MSIFYKTYFLFLILTCSFSEMLSMSALYLVRLEKHHNKINELHNTIRDTNDVNVLNHALIQAINLDPAMFGATEIAREAIEKGANNFEEACKLAEKKGHIGIFNLIKPRLVELVKNVRMSQIELALTPGGEKLPPQVLSSVMIFCNHNEKTW